MFNYGYDDIYGVPLKEYLILQNLELSDLIQKVEIDIGILQSNLSNKLVNNLPYPENYIVNIIYEAIAKKRKHLQRLQNWSLDSKE